MEFPQPLEEFEQSKKPYPLGSKDPTIAVAPPFNPEACFAKAFVSKVEPIFC